MSFCEGFVWGAASAAYQIEGGALEDGRGLSIWDWFSHVPGKTFNGHTGDVACDAYHRVETDLDLMQDLGIRNYRFSLSWPRIIPDGTVNGSGGKGPAGGGLNPAGIAYYDRVVDGCLARGIRPWITLYHWDLPLELYKKGGWMNRETADRFADYAAFIASHFRGRVSHYFTVNEPQCAIGMGMGSGLHAPGLRLDDETLFLCWHNLLLAHGLAVREIRQAVPEAVIGVSSTGALAYMRNREESGNAGVHAGETREKTGNTGVHAGETPEELRRASFLSLPVSQNPAHYFNHQWFLDPVILGHYPDDPENPWSAFAASVPGRDLDTISAPIDLIGLNIYNGQEMAPDEGGILRRAEKYPGYPRTALKWPVTPEVMYWGPRLIFERYHNPVCITENGQSCNDRIFLDGKVHDPDRIDFLHRYLLELRRACRDGIPVKGYFHWSLTDNYEWHSGYDDRFGLIYVDYRTQERIVKDSAAWYSEVIRTNGESL